MKILSPEEYDLLRMPNVPLESTTWSNNPGGVEYLLLEDSEWTEKALRVYELIKETK